jgi:signal transduction histidine kinase
LRTPLSRIVAETDLLLGHRSATPDQDMAHRAIRESALMMDRILDTLLSAARSNVQDAPGRCELRSVMCALASTHAGSAQDERVHIVVTVPDGLAVGADSAIVERIVAPILDNALRYARREVAVTAHRTSEAIIVDVADDGPGVPSELREAVFEPGRRGVVDDGHDGAGLGLALSRRLARSAAGEVTIEGDDARFRVRLPPA